MRGYKEITNQTEMDELLEKIGGFHDSMGKEFHLINRGFVDFDKSMRMNHQFDGRVLIQSQWEPHGLELLFENISDFEVNSAEEYFGGSGIVEHHTTPVIRREIKMKFDSSLKISAGRLFYREREMWLGARAYFGSEIPSSEMVEAYKLEGNWRRCSKCADAWEGNCEAKISSCPNCKSITE